MPVSVASALLKIVNSIGWACQSYRSVAKKHMEKLFVEQSHLALEVVQLRTEVLNMQQAFESNIKERDAEIASL